MSFNVELLKSASDDLIPSFLRAAENGTTSVLAHSTIYEFGKIGKGARIINNDSLNDLQVQLHTDSATALIVPPASELSIEEWFSTIILTPDGVTGDFQLTLELADLNEARK